MTSVMKKSTFGLFLANGTSNYLIYLISTFLNELDKIDLKMIRLVYKLNLQLGQLAIAMADDNYESMF